LVHAEQQSGEGKALPSADRTRLLGDLGVQVAELSMLTDELVELSRENASPEAPVEVDLRELVTAAIDRVRARAPGVRFETSLDSVTTSARPASVERA